MEAQQTTDSHEPTPPEQAKIEPPRYQVPRYSRVPPGGKHPVLAAILSLMPGLGQIYVGYYKNGFIHALVVAFFFLPLNTGMMPEIEPVIIFLLAFFWLYNIIDAARRAVMVNTAIQGGKTPDMPEGFNMPRVGGSIFGGIVLILLGMLFLLNSIADLPLAWIADWWPLVPVAFGVWLLWRGLREKKETAGKPPATGPAEDSAP